MVGCLLYRTSKHPAVNDNFLLAPIDMLDRSSNNADMNKLTREKRCAVVRCLIDGCSVRATVRITGVAKNTIQRITRELGEACLNFQDKALRGLKCKRIQCDEVWCFAYAKDKNLPDEMRGQPGVGSIWTWTALCADTKLIVSWWLGARDAHTAKRFIADVAERLANKIQLTTDGNIVYLNAVNDYFADVDYAMLQKLYGKADDGPETRYSPAKCLGTRKKAQRGNPDMDHCSTSFVERQNLNIRMQNRRYTRLTNAFSKKAEMLAYSVAITFMYHNFVRKHQTLGTTPAVAAGIAKRAWKVEDMVDLIDTPSFRKPVFSN
jgi:IS1 family transposase